MKPIAYLSCRFLCLSKPVIVMLAMVCFCSCNRPDTSSSYTPVQVDSLVNELKTLTASDAAIQQHLATFDTLDYTVFSNREWSRFHESHAKNIKVFWPDGHIATGIDVHIDDMKKLFVYAPDTRIKQHLIKFGSGDFTAVTGFMEGTFTKPMPDGKGKFIQPTGKAFKLPMATIGLWKNGVMVEEHLYWDNQTYRKQLGLQ